MTVNAMTPDMCVPCGDGLVNLRVGAIIRRDGQFLMVGNDRADYLYSVGGRIKFGETAEEAVVREVLEETGTRMEVDRLAFVHENYFYGDMPGNLGKLIYEVCFYYLMDVPAGFAPVEASFAGDGALEHLRWMTPDTPQRYYPEFFRTELSNIGPEVRYFVNDERKRKGEDIEPDLIAYCGVDCAACPDYAGKKCPGCRQTEWGDDPCPPVACCREKGIIFCGKCSDFPCRMMREFYEESDSHRQAYERMRALSAEGNERN